MRSGFNSSAVRVVVRASSVAIACFLFVWLGLRLIHHQHGALAQTLGDVGAVLVEVAIATLLALLLARLLRLGSGGWQQAITLFVWMGLIVIGHHLVFIEGLTTDQILAALNLDRSFGSLLVLSAVYLGLLALPFVPGIEIGLVIIALYGIPGALAVYGATNAALSLSFVVGRLVGRASPKLSLLDRFLAPPPTREKTSGSASIWRQTGRHLRKYRFVVLGLLLNMPGNSALGGGGGISMLCGMSREMPWRWFVLTTLIATSPLPLLITAGVLSADMLR